MHKSKYNDYIGQRFGKLVVGPVERVGKLLLVKCYCDCGTIKYVPGSKLRDGDQKSCGCGRPLLGGHGSAKNPLFTLWRGIIRRCMKPEHRSYKGYGSRGIRLCHGWHDLNKFSSEMGPRPSLKHSVDRKDNDGHYSCGNCTQCLENGWIMNCRWATMAEQSLNRRNTVKITYQGVTKPLLEWANERGIKPPTLACRIRAKWPPEQALGFEARTLQPPTPPTQP